MQTELDISGLTYNDPDPSTPWGIRFFLFKELPTKKVLSLDEFRNLIRSSDSDKVISWDGRKENIPIHEVLGKLGKLQAFSHLVPVIVDNIESTNPDDFIEGNCTSVFIKEGIKIYQPNGSFEYAGKEDVGLIRFTNWPEEFPITDFLEINIKDELDQTISFNNYDNRTIQLHLTRTDGFYDINLKSKNPASKCQYFARRLNYPYPFPYVQITIDSVYGTRDQEVCIPVTAKNMRSITDFTIPLYWNRDSLKYHRINSLHPLLDPIAQRSVSGIGDKEIFTLRPKPEWSDTLTIPDGEVLFELCVVPQVSGSGNVRISGSPPTETNGEEISFEIINVPTDHYSNDGMVYLLDDQQFHVETEVLCSSNSPEHHNLEIKITGNNGPYTYSLPSSGIPDSTFSDSLIVIRDIPPGEYSLTVTNSYGSIIASSLDLSPGAAIGNFDVRIDSGAVVQPGCGQSRGQVGISVSPGESRTYQYLWVEGSIESPDSLFSDIPAGNHTFRVTDENQCSQSLEYKLKAMDHLSISWDEDDLTICPEAKTASIPIEVSATAYTITIDHVDTFESPKSLSLTEGVHHFSLHYNGCSLDTSLTVSRSEKLQITPPIPERITREQGQDIQLEFNASQEVSSIEWVLGNQTISRELQLDMTAESKGILFVDISYPPGCKYNDSIWIEINSREEINNDWNLPNAFTPNGDGQNDVFVIPISDSIAGVSHLEIYNRYGGIVYSAKKSIEPGSDFRWDGTVNGQSAPADVYAVKAVLLLSNGQYETVTWAIHLFR
ncbi:T9SS type B sorting domain-containing protein [Membranihabitans maritimus]|uniref:T9SS type B sorting domain-containing protein n=1 Tax=Membranihabitans maritimus TaxID=2904244 RepID=UPI001F20FDB4|nr:T9SS type B sorting domain-containing protein [Membranihabitans maritimus]